MLIPDSAIATEQADRVVFVVNNENQVESRIVKLGSLVGSQRIIRSGLLPTDKVITQGTQRVGIGQVVAVQDTINGRHRNKNVFLLQYSINRIGYFFFELSI